MGGLGHRGCRTRLFGHHDPRWSAGGGGSRGSDGVDPSRTYQLLPPDGTAKIYTYLAQGWNETQARNANVHELATSQPATRRRN